MLRNFHRTYARNSFRVGEMIQPGDWLRCREQREYGRSVKVLGVYRPSDEPGLQKAFATVLSRGRVSVFSLDRIEDPSRFEAVK